MTPTAGCRVRAQLPLTHLRGRALEESDQADVGLWCGRTLSRTRDKQSRVGMNGRKSRKSVSAPTTLRVDVYTTDGPADWHAKAR